MKNIILMAPPAGGKGTISELLVRKFNYIHISTGDLLREIAKEDSDFGREIKEILISGKLVDDETVFRLLEERLKRPDVSNGFILDGFPRKLSQAIRYDKVVEKLGIDIGVVILIDIDKSLLRDRIVGRRLCKECGAIYNIYSEMRPKVDGICDKCGGEIYQRNDDNEETFEKRYNDYLELTTPVLDYYCEKGLVKAIQNNEDKEIMLKEIESVIND